jgi:hypothetical protein
MTIIQAMNESFDNSSEMFFEIDNSIFYENNCDKKIIFNIPADFCNHNFLLTKKNILHDWAENDLNNFLEHNNNTTSFISILGLIKKNPIFIASKNIKKYTRADSATKNKLNPMDSFFVKNFIGGTLYNTAVRGIGSVATEFNNTQHRIQEGIIEAPVAANKIINKAAMVLESINSLVKKISKSMNSWSRKEHVIMIASCLGFYFVFKVIKKIINYSSNLDDETMKLIISDARVDFAKVLTTGEQMSPLVNLLKDPVLKLKYDTIVANWVAIYKEDLVSSIKKNTIGGILSAAVIPISIYNLEILFFIKYFFIKSIYVYEKAKKDYQQYKEEKELLVEVIENKELREEKINNPMQIDVKVEKLNGEVNETLNKEEILVRPEENKKKYKWFYVFLINPVFLGAVLYGVIFGYKYHQETIRLFLTNTSDTIKTKLAEIESFMVKIRSTIWTCFLFSSPVIFYFIFKYSLFILKNKFYDEEKIFKGKEMLTWLEFIKENQQKIMEKQPSKIMIEQEEDLCYDTFSYDQLQAEYEQYKIVCKDKLFDYEFDLEDDFDIIFFKVCMQLKQKLHTYSNNSCVLELKNTIDNQIKNFRFLSYINDLRELKNTFHKNGSLKDEDCANTNILLLAKNIILVFFDTLKKEPNNLENIFKELKQNVLFKGDILSEKKIQAFYQKSIFYENNIIF